MDCHQLRRDVDELISCNFEACTKVYIHRDPITGQEQDCCKSALIALRCSAFAHAARHDDGFEGVLKFLQSFFAWGFKRCCYLCDIYASPAEIDCGSRAAVAVFVLNEYLDNIRLQSSELSTTSVSVQHVPHPITCIVQVVLKANASDGLTYRRHLYDLYGAEPSYSSWIKDNAVYHQVVGFISPKTNQLAVWDFGEWIDPSDLSSSDAIVAMKVVPTCTHELGNNAMITWKEKALPVGEWVNFLNEEPQLSSSASRTSSEDQMNSIGDHRSPIIDELFSPQYSDGIIDFPLSRVPSTIVVCIAGCHMSINPVSGVGIARCLRSWENSHRNQVSFKLLAIDDLAIIDSFMSGMRDMCWDEGHSIDSIGIMRRRQASYRALTYDRSLDEGKTLVPPVFADFHDLWLNLVSIFAESRINGKPLFFIPTYDRDVEFSAARKSWVSKLQVSASLPEQVLKSYQTAAASILCPTYDSLKLVDKPTMPGVVATGWFTVPEHFTVPSLNMVGALFNDLLAEVNAFCDHVGYPLLIKGQLRGAVLCYSWAMVAHELSEHHRSYRVDDDCIIEEGKIPVCCFVQKVMSGSEKTIAFAAVDGHLTGCLMLEKAVLTIEGKVWSGFLTPVPEALIDMLKKFVLDSKWTGGGEFEFIESLTSGLNSNLTEDDKPTWYIIDANPRFPAWIYACSHIDGCNLPADLIRHAVQVSEGNVEWDLDPYLNFPKFSFARTVVEEPTKHFELCRKDKDFFEVMMHSTKGIREEDKEAPIVYHAQYGGQNGNHVEEIAKELAESENNEPSSLLTSSHVLLNDPALKHTPTYIFDIPMMSKAMRKHSAFLKSVIDAAQEDAGILSLQMCYSVKTQPHVAALQIAKKHGYYAECISMAEVRAALNQGFEPHQIILTGPGKFWDTPDAGDDELYEAHCKNTTLKLGAIFADSVSDLRSILRRINDKVDPLDCFVLGVRFQQFGGRASRFGVDAMDAAAMEEAASLIRFKCHMDIKLGVHLHFATNAPNTGIPKWIGMAKSAATLAAGFSDLCRRPLSVLDLGGGFTHHVIDDVDITSYMTEAFQHLLKEVYISAESKSQPVQIQFELGKSVTEQAGGLISRVLEVREIECASKAKSDGYEVKKQALITDTCVGEISCPHVHAIYWQPADNASTHWHPLAVGKGEIWGRTCMEFDVLVGSTSGWGFKAGTCGRGNLGIDIPKEMKNGDFLLFAGCGSYDMSMQYDFGDGQGRSNCHILD